MQVKRVVSQLKLKYPGKKIIMNNRNRPTEIVCEIEPTREHLDYSRAIAVIDKSLPHYHQKTTLSAAAESYVKFLSITYRDRVELWTIYVYNSS